MRAIITLPLMAAICLCAGIAVAEPQLHAGAPNSSLGSSLAQNRQQPLAAANQNATVVPEQPQSGTSTSLSHQLSRSHGVIHPPPSGDRAVIVPPNESTSRTPVIPPPGTPGGNPLVQPK